MLAHYFNYEKLKFKEKLMIIDSIKIKRAFPLIDRNYLMNIYWFNTNTK
jgi:hypothetical protein